MNKDEQIRWMNSLTNATNAVSNLKVENQTAEELQNLIESMANWYYRISPVGSELESKIKACNNREELDSLKEEIKTTGDKNIYATFNDKILELNARQALEK